MSYEIAATEWNRCPVGHWGRDGGRRCVRTLGHLGRCRFTGPPERIVVPDAIAEDAASFTEESAERWSRRMSD